MRISDEFRRVLFRSRYILLRVAATVPVMAVVALFVFLLLRLTPGDPAAVIAGDYATAEDIVRIRERLGLNEPLPLQFITWVGLLLQGDLGTSIFTNLPVTTLIGQRLEPTVMLALTTIVLSVAVAVPLGAIAAWQAGRSEVYTSELQSLMRIPYSVFCSKKKNTSQSSIRKVTI